MDTIKLVNPDVMVAVQLLYAVVTAGCIVRWWRRPSPAARDVSAFMGSLLVATLAAFVPAGSVGSEAAIRLGSAALMLTPWLFLLLVRRTTPVRREVVWAAGAGAVGGAAALMVLGHPLPPGLAGVVTLVWIGTGALGCTLQLVAAWRARGGRRLVLALPATTPLSLVLLVILGVAAEELGTTLPGLVLTPLVIVSAIGLWLGFAPPRALLRLWVLSEADRFRREGKDLVAELPARLNQRAGSASARLSVDLAGTDTTLAQAGTPMEGWVVDVPLVTPATRALLRATFPVEPLFSGAVRELVRALVSVAARPLQEAGRQQVLRDELERLTRANETLAAEARQRAEFVANLSHELRTPLNSVLGFTELLAEDSARMDPAHASMVRDVQAAASHLVTQVDDLRDLARLDAGALKFRAEPFDLESVLHGVADALQPTSAVPIIVHVNRSVRQIEGDQRRVRQVVYNFASNALKFTQRGRVTIEAVDMPGDQVRLSVTDTGIGIPAEDLPKLFNRYERLGRAAPGTGLGLALTRDLVVGMGGEVGLRSTPGEGSTFWAMLPRQLSRVPVLLVLGERDPGVDQLAAQNGMRVRYALRARTAAEAIRRERVDAVLASDADTVDLFATELDGDVERQGDLVRRRES